MLFEFKFPELENVIFRELKILGTWKLWNLEVPGTWELTLGCPDFCNWLPPRRGKCHRHNLRNNNNLSTMPTKSGRFSSSPIMFFIKLLNNV